ncbi:MAG: hypothetical protein CIT01_07940 [Methanobacterium sp. BRmetb2]|jgi:hypothetical protein|nr:MAG: hypothetical protein CIT01_07940 [Methanobacterium sp. BRmetb2]
MGIFIDLVAWGVFPHSSDNFTILVTVIMLFFSLQILRLQNQELNEFGLEDEYNKVMMGSIFSWLY